MKYKSKENNEIIQETRNLIKDFCKESEGFINEITNYKNGVRVITNSYTVFIMNTEEE